MSEPACRTIRRIAIRTGTALVIVSLAACGLPGYHFRDGTTPWLPGGAPSPPAARKKSTPQSPVRKPDPVIPALRRSHEN